MNRRISLLAFTIVVLTASRSLGGAPDKQIKELVLDEHVVYSIPVAGNRVTTVSFPGPIAAIDAALVTVDPKHAGLFQLAHTKGSYFFSVRGLVKEAVTNLNVRWNNKTYVLELHESATPLLSVVFQYSDPGTSNLAKASVTPGKLVALLDKAKAYPLLKASHPEAVEQVEYVNYSEKPPVMDYKDFEIRIEEVFRFDAQDTLVFRVVMQNKTDHEVLYDPKAFAVRVGERLYTQSISDASGTIPPKSDAPAYFAITGTPTGGRNDISIKNDFTVLVARIDPATADLPRHDSDGYKK